MTSPPNASQICFGLSEETDRSSLAVFLQLCGQKEFADLFAARLSSLEIEELTNQIMQLLRRHLSEDEYHAVFLQDTGPHR
jgi:hypothetical protein